MMGQKYILIIVLLSSLALFARAKKASIKEDYVTQTLRNIGGEHFPEGLVVRKVDYIKAGKAYYHVFSGKTKEDPRYEGRTIIFNNEKVYLGYCLRLPRSCSDYYIQCAEGVRIPLGEAGPWDKWLNEHHLYCSQTGNITFERITVESFLRAPGEPNIPPQREARTWTVVRNGKKTEVFRARYAFPYYETHVYLLKENSDTIEQYPLKLFSREDQEYVKQIEKNRS